MSYQVIARKYRPQRFADVVGQEHVTQTLINAIEQNRIAHAYLFVGPRGTGKTTIARIFSMCLNCTGGPKANPPLDDPRCLEISEGRSLDVLEIDGASNRGIEEIRALRDTVKYAPTSGKYKIYIIDEVHMLTKEAFNALLKTLEEPPEHVKFMFATTEPEKVLPTILSRCQRYDLRRIPANRIAQHLGFIAQQEQVAIDEAARLAIARGSEGCMRDAESTLDQLISFCGAKIEENDVLSMFGLAARGQIQALAGILLNGEAGQALEILQTLEKNGKDLSRILSDLLEHFRNLLIFQISKGNPQLLEITEAETEVMKAQAGTASLDLLTRVMETLADGENRLRDAVSKKIFVEVTLLKAMQARHAVSLDSVLQQLAQLRAAGPDAKFSPTPAAPPKPAPARTTATAPKPEPIRELTVADELKEPATAFTSPTPQPAPLRPPSAPVSAEPVPAPQLPLLELAPTEPAAAPGGQLDLEASWQRIVEAVGQTSQFTRTYLQQAHPVSLTKTLLTIGFPPEASDSIDFVDNAKNRKLIQDKVRELGLGDVQIKIIKISSATAPAKPHVATDHPSVAAAKPESLPPVKEKKPVRRAPEGKPEAKPEPEAPKPTTVLLDKDEFKNDPLIKQALEIFKGQILEVRGTS
jgi:DNA polymerase III subunit gamma/tau